MQNTIIQLLIKIPRRILRAIFALILAIPATLEHRLFYKKINQTQISKTPVFILGHWRSGTTYLHSLMAQDEQFGVLTNAQAFVPMVMFLRQNWVQKIMKIIMPKERWDGVKLNPESPQEEEFALFRLFGGSAYSGFHYPHKLDYFFRKYGLLEFDSKTEYETFKTRYFYLLKKLSLSNEHKTLLLKNPPNTGRVAFLLKLFPDAKFIYLKRNPAEVLLSTNRMQEQMIQQFSITGRGKTNVATFIKKFHHDLIEKYESEKHLIPENRLIEIHYETYLHHPLATLESIYEQLAIPKFSQSRTAFQSFIEQQKSHQPANWEVQQVLV